MSNYQNPLFASSFNPWIGCHKIAPGCEFCTVYQYTEEPGRIRPYDTNPRPLLDSLSPGDRVLLGDLTDIFIAEADPWREDLWTLLRSYPWLTFFILTKRPETVYERLPQDWPLLRNIWLGVSASNLSLAEKKVTALIALQTERTFIAFEPLIERITFTKASPISKVEWIMVGGEVGPQARPATQMLFEGIFSSANDCKIPVAVSQVGSWNNRNYKWPTKFGEDPQYWPRNLVKRELPKIDTHLMAMSTITNLDQPYRDKVLTRYKSLANIEA